MIQEGILIQGLRGLGGSPIFAVLVKLVLVADVDVEANTLEETIATGKTWGRTDIVTLDSAAAESDSKVSVRLQPLFVWRILAHPSGL
jgi:hypothetical protein